MTVIDVAAAAVRRALTSGDLSEVIDLLADDVVFGDCFGRNDVEAMVSLFGALSPRDVDVSAVDRRIVASFTLGEKSDATDVYLALFLRDGAIAEIAQAEDRNHAIELVPVGPLPEAAARAARLDTVAPIFPVGEIDAALAHYALLGFETRAYEGDAPYGFAERDGVSLHLTRVGELDPASSTSAAYLYVSDADALFAEWRLSGAAGRLIAPTDTDYGLREGAHIDPDGNLIRFGSGL